MPRLCSLREAGAGMLHASLPPCPCLSSTSVLPHGCGSQPSSRPRWGCQASQYGGAVPGDQYRPKAQQQPWAKGTNPQFPVTARSSLTCLRRSTGHPAQAAPAGRATLPSCSAPAALASACFLRDAAEEHSGAGAQVQATAAPHGAEPRQHPAASLGSPGSAAQP